MLQNVLKKIFGDRNQRLLKKIRKSVDQINALEPGLQQLSDRELAAKTNYFKEQIHHGVDLEKILPESFAVVREASVRVLGLRHFDVQLIGGMVLNAGKIAEMKTGEGKTLMATLPAYLNALGGSTVHIVTVNHYLAQRDAEWMGKVYNFLGLSVGIVLSGQNRDQKKLAYQSDIVYGTNNEFGFDYLRDNMVFSSEDRFQKGLDFAIVDEVDSILIDEARTPLIISGLAEESNDLYKKINLIIPKLEKQIEEDGYGDFVLDEKSKQVSLTEAGHEKAEELLITAGLLEEGRSLYEVSNIGLMHHLYAALRANNIFHKDVDYIVRDGKVIIIDEFTGRIMWGRRWSDGLHQAIEAKEDVEIQQENQTLASITFQNYFRLYNRLSGMTGTADTEAPEFLQIYGLEVVIIPTNQPMIRQDHPDLVYRTLQDKYSAICDGIKMCLKKRQPVLVGSASIESSELLSNMLQKSGIDHQVLNAKHYEKEAEIIAEAGRPSKVTIATNMAGRGTDIVLGGNLEIELAGVKDSTKKERIRKEWNERHQQALDAGGLHVLGTERNESRRIDNQLRGRCGRQGDPGSSQFYLSMDDNLVRIFGSKKIASLMKKLGMVKGEAIDHPWVTRAIENAQKKVEGHNFDVRKQLLEYDNVANEQRQVIYEQRNILMETDHISEYISNAQAEVVNSVINRSIPPQTLEKQWDIPALEQNLQSDLGIELPVQQWLNEEETLHEESLRQKIMQSVDESIRKKEELVGSDEMRHFEKVVMLKVMDERWKEHLANTDYLRQGIGLRGYAQKNPKQEYKRESFEMFTAMLDSVKFEVISIIAKFHIPTKEEIAVIEKRPRLELAEQKSIHCINAYTQKEISADNSGEVVGKKRQYERKVKNQTYVRHSKKIGRNKPCPCKSGKKYKKCHGGKLS